MKVIRLSTSKVCACITKGEAHLQKMGLHTWHKIRCAKSRTERVKIITREQGILRAVLL